MKKYTLAVMGLLALSGFQSAYAQDTSDPSPEERTSGFNERRIHSGRWPMRKQKPRLRLTPRPSTLRGRVDHRPEQRATCPAPRSVSTPPNLQRARPTTTARSLSRDAPRGTVDHRPSNTAGYEPVSLMTVENGSERRGRRPEAVLSWKSCWSSAGRPASSAVAG